MGDHEAIVWEEVAVGVIEMRSSDVEERWSAQSTWSVSGVRNGMSRDEVEEPRAGHAGADRIRGTEFSCVVSFDPADYRARR